MSIATALEQPPIRKHDAWRHQLEAYHFANSSPFNATLLAIVMGGGKSMVNIQLTENWGIKAGLILCPLAVLPVWRREFYKHSASGIRILILESGSVADKTRQADEFLRQGPGVVCINYDSARNEAFAAWAVKRRWDLVTLDESHRCFPAGTLVSTPSGDIPIEHIRDGQEVYSYCHETDRVVASRVSATMSHENGLGYSVGQRFASTPNHPVWTRFGYVNADALTEFDELAILENRTIAYEQAEYPAYLQAMPKGISGSPKDIAVLQQELQIQAAVRQRPIKTGAVSAKHAGNDCEAGSSGETRRASFITQESVQQQGGACSNLVYNIETEHSNYFANGVLVHNCKSSSGKTSKLVHKLGRLAGRRLCLTGTPMPHSPLDIYGQYRFAAPGIFGPSFVRFRARYAITDRMFPSKVLKWINQEEFAAQVGKIMYRVDSSVLDLPPVMHETRTFDLSPKAKRAYRELEQDLITELDSGTVTVDNALVKLLRLQQITSGWLPTGEGRGERLDMGKEALLADFLADLPSDEPVVVFCRFRTDLDCVRQATHTLKRRYGELSGQRRDLTNHATMRDDVDVMGVQIASGGTGIDLTRAAYAVYFSVNWALGDYEQSLARLHRPGQERSVRYYHLIAKGTVDADVYSAFESKRSIIQSVLERLSSRYAA